MISNRDMMEGISILTLRPRLNWHCAFSLQEASRQHFVNEICMAFVRQPPQTAFMTLPVPSLLEREFISFFQEENTLPE